MQPIKICIGPSIRIGRESWCLPYAGFFVVGLATSAVAVEGLVASAAVAVCFRACVFAVNGLV